MSSTWFSLAKYCSETDQHKKMPYNIYTGYGKKSDSF